MLRHVHTMSRVPRTFGAETNFTPSGGMVQLLEKLRIELIVTDDMRGRMMKNLS